MSENSPRFTRSKTREESNNERQEENWKLVTSGRSSSKNSKQNKGTIPKPETRNKELASNLTQESNMKQSFGASATTGTAQVQSLSLDGLMRQGTSGQTKDLVNEGHKGDQTITKFLKSVNKTGFPNQTQAPLEKKTGPPEDEKKTETSQGNLEMLGVGVIN